MTNTTLWQAGRDCSLKIRFASLIPHLIPVAPPRGATVLALSQLVGSFNNVSAFCQVGQAAMVMSEGYSSNSQAVGGSAFPLRDHHLASKVDGGAKSFGSDAA